VRMFSGETLVLATHNRGKLEEIEALMAPLGISVRSAADIGLEEPVETEDSFVGNARIKAHYAAQKTGLPALADDSGITVDALGGAPGVYTADWAETPNGRDFLIAMTRTWDLVQASGAQPPYSAQFRCTLVLAWPDGHDEVFEGIVRGTLVWPLRGALGHGYDPMFQPDGYAVTFAEMTAKHKNGISHRADAFRKLIGHCFT
jgi:XTP/dITP diphosphohydrolase